MTSPELTVVVITHNRADLVDQMLGSIATQSWPDGSWDVIVVDNASSDHTSTVLDRWTTGMPVAMSVVSATQGRGPAYARNTGARHASAPHLAFVDDDDLLAPGWVAAIGRALREHDLVAPQFDYAHLNHPVVAAASDTHAVYLPEFGGVPVASGGGLGCHRGLWNRLGGMNESLRYGEDTDFSLRASEVGSDPVFVADALYRVRLRPTTRAAFRRGRYLGLSAVDRYIRVGRAGGEHPDGLGLLVRVFAGYLTRLPSLTDAGLRLVYAEQLGRRTGRIQGSLRTRVWFP